MEIYVGIFLCLMVIGILIITLTLSEPKTSFQRQPQRGTLPGINFTPTQMYRGPDGRSGIAINEQTYQICLLNDPTTQPRVLDSKDLMGSFLILNGEIIGQGVRTKPKALQKFLRVLQTQIQAQLKYDSSEEPSRDCHRIDLIVAIRDQDAPLHTVTFLDMETKAGGIIYQKAINAAHHWHALMDELILKADHFEHLQGNIRDDKATLSEDSLASELATLTDLLEKQLITKQEFEAQKEKILAVKT
jgi:hypothetical protein